jgi:hypothetical protein
MSQVQQKMIRFVVGVTSKSVDAKDYNSYGVSSTRFTESEGGRRGMGEKEM